MSAIPLPSHVHYELLLQLLERQSILTVEKPQHRDEMQQLIITLRKAVVLQQQLEETLDRDGLRVEYRWSLNQTEPPAPNAPAEPNAHT